MDDATTAEQSADERHQALNVRESRLEAQESRQSERRDDVKDVLAQAAHRDEVADARDRAAAKRDMAANMQAWLNGNEGHAHAEARQEASGDRVHSKEDRTSSAVDRALLADDDDPRDSGT
jgi:hypothetical protein